MRIFPLTVLLCCLSACEPEPVWIEGWQVVSTLNTARAGHASAQNDQFVYVIGGVDGRRYLQDVEVASLDGNGELGQWRYTTPLPAPRGFADAFVSDGWLYVVGGASGEHGQSLYRSALRAAIGADGELGPWQQTASMLTPRRCNKVALMGDSVLAVGGFAGNLLDTVEQASLGENGLVNWQLSSERLGSPRYVHAQKIIGDSLLVSGGHAASSGKGLQTTEIARFSEGRWRWRPGANLSQGRYGHAMASVQGRVYALGGLSAGRYLASVEMNDMLKNREANSWYMSTNLPENMANFTTLTDSDRYLFVLGGVAGTRYFKRILRAEVNAQGRLGFWGDAKQARDLTAIKEQGSPNTSHLLAQAQEVLQTPGYTYVKIRHQGQVQWLAGPRLELAPGDRLRYSPGNSMGRFHSKQLQRTFDNMVFVTVLEKQE